MVKINHEETQALRLYKSKNMLSVFSDEYYMKQAYQEAQAALEADEIPIGAVVVCNNKIIARAHNQTETLNDVTAHAEMLAITAAANALGAKYLDECTLYVTLEPCPMCAGALCHSHIGKVVWAADDPKNGFSRFGNMLHPKTKTETGVMHDDCLALLTDFFKRKRLVSGIAFGKKSIKNQFKNNSKSNYYIFERFLAKQSQK